jgi:hypothetical protein
MNTFEQADKTLAKAFEEGLAAGVETTCAELIETFKGIPMWGSVAVYHINKLLEDFQSRRNSK